MNQLTKVENSISTTEYTEYDILNRVTKSKQTTDGTAYNEMEYSYNLSGALIETKYPSGRVVRNELDNDGRLSIVQSKKNENYGYWDYAKGLKYTAAGAVSDMQLGNGKWESTTFNSRLQPIQIALGTVQDGVDKLKLNFEYNTGSNTDNNGNVLKQTIKVENVGTYPGFEAAQNYTYDELNRLKTATENIDGNQTPSWKETNIFDRYGNKNFDEANTTTLTKLCPSGTNLICASDRKRENPEIDPANNRIKELQPDGDSVKDYEYDTAGNTKKDTDGRNFIYDGENKQVEVKNSTGGTIGQYWYDGDGKRVKKYVPSTGETTIFHYDAGGKLIAEYSTIVETSNPQVSYLTNDHLGSPRITTDKDGDVKSRRDFTPFGEEITSADTLERSIYGSDSVRKKFTSYERDNETDLDFAQARYFNSGFGRFSSPDPLYLEFRRLPHPQAWNLYAYARNNPHTFIDPDGLEVKVKCNGKACTQAETDLNNRKDGQFKVEIKDGYYRIVGNVKFSELTKSEQKLYSAITDTFFKTTLNVVESSDEITFGRADGPGENTVDLSDLSKLNETGNTTLSGEAIAHEIVEGYESDQDLWDETDERSGGLEGYQKSGRFKRSHDKANEVFGNVTVSVAPAPSGASGDNREATYNFGRLDVSLTVTKKFATKIPLASINTANFANAKANVDKVVINKGIPK